MALSISPSLTLSTKPLRRFEIEEQQRDNKENTSVIIKVIVEAL
jgi:hypothetical protein